ncbi:hypothetical protein AVEN_181197-1 [Araneus ventricosus]|uniref:Uncharacterized protein n=1 Tax=Araneus ventricosus TaxID=182803 RepID=A0A4Y2WS50_ARAVE|nr:hypothetical protein AVEN_90729-1 [Araneus ventricosus]GBO39599.1 hypothetical protein AVEN_181197-1 [Araneus ventricosus]
MRRQEFRNSIPIKRVGEKAREIGLRRSRTTRKKSEMRIYINKILGEAERCGNVSQRCVISGACSVLQHLEFFSQNPSENAVKLLLHSVDLKESRVLMSIV